VTIALVDYGAGNLTSVIKAFRAVGAEVQLTGSADAVAGARAIVVPGVGNFAATGSLGPDWSTTIRQAVSRGVPLFGICLGLQWLFEGSAEAPGTPGLGLEPGQCFLLKGDVKVPHVGWNTLALADRPSRLFAGIPSGASAYFTHSFAAPLVNDTIATTTHAMPFSAAVERDRVFGVQFHPEKSGTTGLAILRNFLNIAREAA
jgi:imidazole glycerol-phosphate synthase subunit HisH